MGKPTVILADTDFGYLSSLEIKFLEEHSDEIELEVITDANYFEERFSNPISAEILVVSEELYYSGLQKQNIQNTYVLSEMLDSGGTEDLKVTKIYKYTNPKEIYNQVIATSSGAVQGGTKKKTETEVIVFYSAAGGVGRTTLSLVMSRCLAKSYKRVLYVNAQHINSFQFYLSNTAPAPSSVYSELLNPDLRIFERIKYVVRKEAFDYIPPFGASLPSLNVEFSIYEEIIKSAKALKEYDFIVVDTDPVFDLEKASLLTMADKVIITTTQSIASVNATNMLLKNMSCSDTEKYIFVCNKFNSEKYNALMNAEERPMFSVSEYINEFDDTDNMSLEDLSAYPDMQKLSFLVI